MSGFVNTAWLLFGDVQYSLYSIKLVKCPSQRQRQMQRKSYSTHARRPKQGRHPAFVVQSFN